jgi:hypothetical protein
VTVGETPARYEHAIGYDMRRLVVGACVAAGLVIVIPPLITGWPPWKFAPLAVVPIAGGFALAGRLERMVLRVTDTALEVRTWFGRVGREWPLSDIEACKVRKTRGSYCRLPFMRWGPAGLFFDEFDTVDVRLRGGKQVLLASDEPEALVAALRDATGDGSLGRKEPHD